MIFQGTISPEVRSILLEHARGWDCEDFYVGCSGAFTVERTLAPLGKRLHGCDVSLYTCAIGCFYSGEALEVWVKDAWAEAYGWMTDYLDEPARTVATVMLGSTMLQGVTRGRNPWYERMERGYRDQWESLHARMTERVEGLGLKLASFRCEDVATWLDRVPDDQAVVSFPPTYGSGYSQMFKGLDSVLGWHTPDFVEMDAEGRLRTLEAMRTKRYWITLTDERLEGEDWEECLRGRVQTSAGARPVYVYAGDPGTRVTRFALNVEPVLSPRVNCEEDLEGELGIASLSAGQFLALRSQYLDPKIMGVPPQAPFAITVGGKITGVAAFNRFDPLLYVDPRLPRPALYLLSDFAVRPGPKRMSKLVLYAALSHEMRLLLERYFSSRVRSLMTTAFTQNPVSMKYRGMLELLSRKDSEKDDYCFELNYGSPLGKWSLAEGMALWKAKR